MIEIFLCVMVVINAITIIVIACYLYRDYQRELQFWGTNEPWNEERYQQLREEWHKREAERRKKEN